MDKVLHNLFRLLTSEIIGDQLITEEGRLEFTFNTDGKLIFYYICQQGRLKDYSLAAVKSWTLICLKSSICCLVWFWVLELIGPGEIPKNPLPATPLPHSGGFWGIHRLEKGNADPPASSASVLFKQCPAYGMCPAGTLIWCMGVELMGNFV